MNNGRASRWSIHRVLSHGAVMKCEYSNITMDGFPARGKRKIRGNSERGEKRLEKVWLSVVLTLGETGYPVCC
jgi:hypothetical protein